MSNRQQRRHPPKPTAVPDLGERIVRLPQPEFAAEITVLHSNEIRSRNEIITRLESDVNAARETLQHLERLRIIAMTEKTNWIRNLCRQLGLSDDEEFNVDLDRGALFRTARSEKIVPPEREYPEPEKNEPEPTPVGAESKPN